MKISSEWINSFLQTPAPARELAEAMEAAGLEVDEVISAPRYDELIVTGKILEVTPHPNADRLKVTKVDVKKATFEIVCGAPNVAVGQIVPVATPGATLPDGTTITAAKLRGVESNGMLCSERELCLSENHAGIMVLPEETAIGAPLEELIKGSDVIDATTSANRWDLTSMLGIAREVAAQTNQKITRKYPEHLTSSAPSAVAARVEDARLAPRYMLARLKVDNTKPTPQWMADRLLESGVRPISVVVDITNYVLLEYGQPLHAFDAAKVSGDMVVRSAFKDETLVTLDGQKRMLSADDIVIADSQRPLGLAGVMGGQNSEVDEQTTEIILESAVFDPALIRKTAVRHGLRSDASARFERRVPLDLSPYALGGAQPGEGAIGLLQEHAGAELVGGILDVLSETPVHTRISADVTRISALLGLKLTAETVREYLERLDFTVSPSEQPNILLVEVPWWRQDVTVDEDLAEEVIKLAGYDQLPATIPAWAPRDIHFDSTWSARWKAKQALLSCGLFEVVTYSFISKEQIEQLGHDSGRLLKLQNPLSSEQAYLRASLIPSLLNVTARNRTYGDHYGIFEFSKVYEKQDEGELPRESTKIGVMVAAPKDGYRAAKAVLDRLCRVCNVNVAIQPNHFDKTVAHPTESALIEVNGRTIGVIARLHPAVAQQHKLRGEVGFIELDWEALQQEFIVPVAHSISRFPTISRDLSVLIERSISWAEVSGALDKYRPQFLSDYYGNDLPEGKKTITLRLVVSREDRTPTDADAQAVEKTVQSLLEERFKASLRH